LKESDKFKKLSIESGISSSSPPTASEESKYQYRTSSLNQITFKASEGQLSATRKLSDIDDKRRDKSPLISSPSPNFPNELDGNGLFEGNNPSRLAERRRIAVRTKDANDVVTEREDQIFLKCDMLRATLRVWLQEETRKVDSWKRSNHPNPNGFFERIQNAHLIPVLMGLFVTLVFLLTLIS
jgi:hypothetical protein